jgi:hypothetical protein
MQTIIFCLRTYELISRELKAAGFILPCPHAFHSALAPVYILIFVYFDSEE